MNIIKFEFFKNHAEISSAEYDSTDKVCFVFPTQPEGYLSVGPRIIKVEGGEATLDLSTFSDGTLGCYLLAEGERYDLPGIEKLGRLFRMMKTGEAAAMAKVAYIKDLEARLFKVEKQLALAEEKIFGRREIL